MSDTSTPQKNYLVASMNSEGGLHNGQLKRVATDEEITAQAQNSRSHARR